MPVRFTQDGASLFPPLAWEGLPPQTQSAVLLVEDSARAMVTLAGKPVLTWKMRELQRFGVTDFVVLGMAEDAAQDDLDHASFGLPKPPRLRFGPAGQWGAVLPHLQARFLLSTADLLFDGNVAWLLRDFAADPVEAAGRTMVVAASGGQAGVWALSAAALGADTDSWDGRPNAGAPSG